MKACTHCKYAAWKKRKDGSLHQSGDGRCTYPYKIPPLPASMRWIHPPQKIGGYINRHEELEEHCTYYVRAILTNVEG